VIENLFSFQKIIQQVKVTMRGSGGSTSSFMLCNR